MKDYYRIAKPIKIGKCLYWFRCWVFFTRFNCNRSGLWPFNLWVRKWNIGLHFGPIADAHIGIYDSSI